MANPAWSRSRLPLLLAGSALACTADSHRVRAAPQGELQREQLAGRYVCTGTEDEYWRAGGVLDLLEDGRFRLAFFTADPSDPEALAALEQYRRTEWPLAAEGRWSAENGKLALSGLVIGHVGRTVTVVAPCVAWPFRRQDGTTGRETQPRR